MDIPLVLTTPRDACAAIAGRWFAHERAHAPPKGDPGAGPALYPHQRDALARLRAALDEFGGALLADETGLGKTYVALAIAAEHPRCLIVAPAALRDLWRRALEERRLPAAFRSVESLSRAGSPAGAAEAPDLVIVDEAHHVRNPATRRYRALAALAASARLLLLSATPVHNDDADLRALLALFLGGRAGDLDAAAHARCIVRRDRERTALPGDVPAVDPPRTLPLAHDDATLDALLALPPPVPPAGGDDGGVLVVWSLVRQWASSDAALLGALRRRLARAVALESALADGAYPSRTELRAWLAADDTVQLALPGLLAAPAPGAGPLRDAVARHAGAVRSLLDRLTTRQAGDAQRAAHLRALRDAHRGASIVCFAEFADTIHGLYRLMRGDAGVAALTAAGARVAGGDLTRAEAIARFAPRASGTPVPPAHGRIGLLLSTDLLSEGVNLQDASVVVHLDVPWTAARLEQRVGRVARLGSAHDRVAVYAMAPPASAERLLGLERRLRDKLRAASRAAGVAGTILPSLVVAADAPAPRPPRSPAQHAEETRAVMRHWVRADGAERDAAPVTADGAVRAAVLPAAWRGFLALCDAESTPLLVADLGDGPTDDPAVVARAVRIVARALARAPDAPPAPGGAEACSVAARPADGPAGPPAPAAVADALRRLTSWADGRAARRDADIRHAGAMRSRRRLLARIAGITRRAPLHQRPALHALAFDARRAAAAPCGAGAERVLAELSTAVMPDEAWLRALTAFGALHARATRAPPARATRQVALVVFHD